MKRFFVFALILLMIPLLWQVPMYYIDPEENPAPAGWLATALAEFDTLDVINDSLEIFWGDDDTLYTKIFGTVDLTNTDTLDFNMTTDDTIAFRLVQTTIYTQTAYGHLALLAANLMGNSSDATDTTKYLSGPSDSIVVYCDISDLYAPGDSLYITVWAFSDSGNIKIDFDYAFQVHPMMAKGDTTHLKQDFATESTPTTYYIAMTDPVHTLVLVAHADTGNRWDCKLQIVVSGLARKPDPFMSSTVTGANRTGNIWAKQTR